MKIRFLIYAVLLLVFVITKGYGQKGQQKYLDSLYALAVKANPDSNSVVALEHVQRFYFNRGLYDSTLKYSKLALPLAKKLNLKKKIAKVSYIMGLSFTNQAQYDSATFYLSEALKFFPEINDPILTVNTYNALAKLYSFQSDYSTAMEYLMKAVDLIDQSPSSKVKEFLPMTYGNIGNTLIEEGQLEKGNEYLQKALAIRGYVDEDRFRLFINLDVFGVYLKQGNTAEAKKHLDSAIALSHEIQNIVATSIVANNEGSYYQTVNDPKRALLAYMKAYQLSDSTRNEYLKAEVGDNISNIYFQSRNYAEAERFAKEAMIIGKKLKHYKVVASTCETLKNIFATKGDFKNALNYADLSLAYADSATNAETQKAILSLESKYQHQKKEKEIIALTSINTQKELAVVKRNRILLGGGIISGAALLILGLLYKNSRQRQLLAEREQSLQREQIKFLEGQQQVASLQGVVKGQDEERGRLAKDLHDGLGGLLSGIKFSLTNMKSSVVLDANSALIFERSLDMLDHSISELRRVAHNMMPEVLVKFGLTEAVKSYCDSLQTSGIFKIDFQFIGMEQRLDSQTEIFVYRIIQELLNNVSKHAKASHVLVQLAWHQNEMNVTVEDNGVGMNPELIHGASGSGWTSIQSRAKYLKGKLDVQSGTGNGTSVHLTIPIS